MTGDLIRKLDEIGVDMDRLRSPEKPSADEVITEFRARGLALGANHEFIDGRVHLGQKAVEMGEKLCDSPIEKIMLPWLVFGDYPFRAPTLNPAQIHHPASPNPPIPDVICITPQMRIGNFRVDFAIVRTGAVPRFVALECDGFEYHDVSADARRDKYLAAYNIRTIRATGSEIYRNARHVFQRVVDALTEGRP